MEQERNGGVPEPGESEGREPEGWSGLGPPEQEGESRPGPTWRGLLMAVIAAILLSVGATLLLGGSFGFARQGAPQGCGPGSECCPPADSRSGGR